MHEQAIVADLIARFRVLDAVELTWSSSFFAENLTRFYGQALPPGSDKQRHCGHGPFLLVIVEDRLPAYGRRRVTNGRAIVNTAMLDAKKRYREWSGGGHRVHTTLSPQETAHDLFLLLGATGDQFLNAPTWNGETRALRADLVGAHGWTDTKQLLTAFDVTFPYVVLRAADEKNPLELLVDDLWWAQTLAKAVGRGSGRHTVRVAGEIIPIILRASGDRSLAPAWQAEILRERVRDAEGTAVPTPLHQLHLALERLAAGDESLGMAAIKRLAARAALAPADYADPDRALRAHAAFVADLGSRGRAQTRRPGRVERLIRSSRRREIGLRPEP